MLKFYEDHEGYGVLKVEHEGTVYGYGYRKATGFVAYYEGPVRALMLDPRVEQVHGGPGTYGHTDDYVKEQHR